MTDQCARIGREHTTNAECHRPALLKDHKTVESKSEEASLQSEIWRVSILIKQLPGGPTNGYKLDKLLVNFEALTARQAPDRQTAEKHIWSIWCDHPEEKAKDQMITGIRQLSAGALSRAENIFNALVRSQPGWAETWNKRATVYFLQNRDTASVKDIYRTLLLEPRHFGALGGLAQICLRNGEADVAEIALAKLIAIHPQAPGVRETMSTLKDGSHRTMH